MPPRPPVDLLGTARPAPPTTRRWDDTTTGRAFVPAQRGPASPRTTVPAAGAPRLPEPLVGSPAESPVGAPSRRRIGLNPDLARVVLAGALLFGALVATIAKPQVVHDPPAPSTSTAQHGGQHAGQAPTRR